MQIVVVGTGLAGLAATLALARSGLSPVIVGPSPARPDRPRDTRTTALFGASIDFLRRIGAPQALLASATPLRALRLIDDTQGLVRAPELLFHAEEVGQASFGYNFDNEALSSALWTLVRTHPAIRPVERPARDVSPRHDGATVTLDDGSSLEAQLVVGADGEASLCRQAAGIASTVTRYPQSALATRLAHARPHQDTSIELHRRGGPLTTVPLPGDWSSLVWVEASEAAQRLADLPEAGFVTALDDALDGLLGAVRAVGPRAVFPLRAMRAERLGARRIALVGEAAHRLAPIGAQGLNLGLRDAAWLADLAARAHAAGEDPGSDAVLRSYERAREGDVASRSLAVDLLNRSLFADWLPLDLARGAGFAALRGLPWLRQLAMRQGMGPGGDLPPLLRPLDGNPQCVSTLP